MIENVNVFLNNLDKRGYNAYFVNTKEDVHSVLLSIMDEKCTVGFGGSQTVEQLEIPAFLKENGFNVLHRTVNTTYDYPTLSKMAQTADWFIASTNAATVGGELVNIDGTANRISAMVYGPKNVVIVMGINKLTENLDKAIDRARNVAAPKNCVRLKKNTPCVKTGKCEENCSYLNSICRATLIQHYPTTGKNVTIIVVNGEYGY